MAKEPAVSRGVKAVALMALSKREFFQRLLDNPRAVLGGVRADLGLTDDDVEVVTRLITEALQHMDPGQILEIWDRWRANGVWDGGDDNGWPTIGGWPTGT